MNREEQVERALAISQKMRANAVKPGRKGPSKLTWSQIDARDELVMLIGAETKQKINDAPPERIE